MKTILLIIIVVCCVLIAFKIKGFYNSKLVFFKHLFNFCSSMQVDISFQNEKIIKIINSQIEAATNKNFFNFLIVIKSFFNLEFSKYELKEELVKKCSFLKINDVDKIYKFFVDLGECFQEDELNKINHFKNWLKIKTQELEDFNKKYATLYFKLFIILGAVLFIIFI